MLQACKRALFYPATMEKTCEGLPAEGMELEGYHYHCQLNTIQRKLRDSSQPHESRASVGKDRPSRLDW